MCLESSGKKVYQQNDKTIYKQNSQLNLVTVEYEEITKLKHERDKAYEAIRVIEEEREIAIETMKMLGVYPQIMAAIAIRTYEKKIGMTIIKIDEEWLCEAAPVRMRLRKLG